jgi:hypothetical protein
MPGEEMPRSQGEGFEQLFAEVRRLGAGADRLTSLGQICIDEINALQQAMKKLERKVDRLSIQMKAKTLMLEGALDIVEGRVRGLRDDQVEREARSTAPPPPPPPDEKNDGDDDS